MAFTIVDRFHPQRRAAWQALADEGRLHQVDELALFSPEQMLPMARFSLYLLVVSGILFIALDLLVYIWRTGQHSGSLNIGQVVLWLLLNIISYIVVLPLHELAHGAAFAFWGGKPYYGTKLPMALYCSAKDQLFPRNSYLVVGLAPLVVITLAGLLFTFVVPALASYVLFALCGNVAGAAGDLWVSRRLFALPDSVFIEDQETGYRAWAMTAAAESVTISPDA